MSHGAAEFDTGSAPPRRFPIGLCYGAFAVSGFAGLVYESIWSRYLQTFLGAEAYAQALVLGLFLGGMAGGAWLAARHSRRLRRPLLAYGIVELALAAFALGFHGVFESAVDWTFASVAPALPAPWAVAAWKWTLASALILPQCVLLGATFPLLAGGVIRHGAGGSGRALGWLYFANGAGGAVGVLANGFLLVPLLGLPNCVVVAGTLNAVAGAMAWGGGRLLGADAPRPATLAGRPFRWRGFCLVVAAATGAASLVYELAWIRLLNLVLGSSTHTFELMLSAFVGGLAIGGFWIRGRADRLADPLRALAYVQLAMGALALLTLLFYKRLFVAMQWLLDALAHSAPGYALFLAGSHALALAVMLPATVCAGMTLPLLTKYQLAAGGGERVIGRTYAANTAGAIVAILATMHWLLPQLGIKGAMLVGAGVDLALGVALLWRAPVALRLGAGAFAAGLVGAAWAAPAFDARILNSGVFAGGAPTPAAADERDILFYRHGKTATVGVTRTPLDDGATLLGFSTNGKGNGALLLDAPAPRASPDEPSFGLLGLLPLLVKPDAERAACIGLGTGLSAHYLLGSPRLTALDVIEMEPATIDAARLFAARTGRVFEDPRVAFHRADARTFFRGPQGAEKRYDVVLSQPSNVWMPGVANLFTEQFYANLGEALADDGLLVQWMQLYAADEPMVFSVLAALGRHFADYRLYLATSGDLLIVAAKRGPVPSALSHAVAWPALADAWPRVGVRGLRDLALRWVGDRAQVEPAIALAGVAANSDFRPLLENRALRAFYRRERYAAFGYWADAFGYPLLAHLADRDLPTGDAPVTELSLLPRSLVAAEAQRLLMALESAGAPAVAASTQEAELPRFGALLPFDEWLALLDAAPCEGFALAGWDRFLPWFVRTAGANLSAVEFAAVWKGLNALECAAQLRARDEALHDFVGAALTRDYALAAKLGQTLLAERNPARRPFVAVATAAAHRRLGDDDALREIIERIEPPTPPGLREALTLIAAHTVRP